MHLGQGWDEGKEKFYSLVVRAFTYNGVESASSTYCDNMRLLFARYKLLKQEIRGVQFHQLYHETEE